MGLLFPNHRCCWERNARIAALEQWGQESRFIHIASHGSFRSDNPLFSAVRLADSYLSVYDRNIRLPVELPRLAAVPRA